MIKPFQILLLLVCGIATMVVYVLLYTGKKDEAAKAAQPVVHGKVAAIQTQLVQADSFMNLLSKAYGILVSVTKQNDNIVIITNSANQVSADVYNAADQLLGQHEARGFSIAYNNETNQTTASFKLRNNFVNVPNDVLIAAMQKAYGATAIKQ